MLVKIFTTGSLGTNTYLVADEGAGQALVVDPAGEVEGLLAFLSTGGLRLTAIVNTHGHYDHVSGNRALKDAGDAPILIHAADAGLAGKASQLARLVSVTAEDSPPADRFLEHGDVVRVGDMSFRVLHTPGHTPGGITMTGQGAAFCGDLVFAGSVGRTDLPGCSEEALFESIRRHIMSLPDETILYPGHGPSTTVGRERRNLRT